MCAIHLRTKSPLNYPEPEEPSPDTKAFMTVQKEAAPPNAAPSPVVQPVFEEQSPRAVDEDEGETDTDDDDGESCRTLSPTCAARRRAAAEHYADFCNACTLLPVPFWAPPQVPVCSHRASPRRAVRSLLHLPIF